MPNTANQASPSANTSFSHINQSTRKIEANGAPRPRSGRNICEVCERALARTDTGMCDFCTVKQQRQAGGVA